MVSPIISCIHTILADLEEFLDICTDFSERLRFNKLIFWFRNLKTFVLCARKLRSHTSLGSFLVRIEDTIRVFAEETRLQGSDMYRDGGQSFPFQSLEEEVDKWYVTLLDPAQDSTFLSADEVSEIIGSILDGLMLYDQFPHRKISETEIFEEAMEALKEQLRFLSCLIWLGTQTSVEPGEDFLAHSETVALDAASLFFASRVDELHKEELQLKISALVRRIKPIDPQVYEAYTQVLRGSDALRGLLPSTEDMDDKVTSAILDTLISNLWEILIRLDTCVVDQLKELYGGLRSLRYILKNQPDKLDLKIGAVLCDAAVFIWPFYRANPEVGLGLHDLLQTIMNILPQIPRVDIRKKEDATSTYNQMPSQRTPPTANEVVGFDKEARSTMERLIRGSRKLRIVAIVGMAGSGKTTLATKAFNDPSVMYHFRVRARCSISQTLNKMKVLLDLLKQIDPTSRHQHDTTEQDLAEKLRRSLKKIKYLIFLDDVWEIDAWKRLNMNGLLFPDDDVGSRIILTSRHLNAAPLHMLDCYPRFLRQLDKEESLELLQMKLLPPKGWADLEFSDILEKIAEVCKGLPLTIVIVAGLLGTTEPVGWKKILNDLSLSLGSVIERCKKTLELSYKNLPDGLRSCLLYFGVFQEDQEVSVRKLIRLWIAEGFVQKTEVKSPEDAAEDYLMDLIGRSLIMVAKQRSDGGVKACRIHDLLHDFCQEKAKNEHFFHFLKGRGELLTFIEPSNLQRLCIDSEAEHFKQSELFCPGVQSLLFNCSQVAGDRFGVEEELLNISFVIHGFKLLKVLDLQQIFLITGFPDEIELLVQLAFLVIRGYIEHIPSSIAHLSNLETLILDTMGEPSLPDSLWNLQKLQYLYIRVGDSYSGGGILAIENLDSSPIFKELDSFLGAAIPLGSMGRLLKKFPNIRRLKCRLLDSEDKEEDAVVVVDFFQSQKLQSLHILYGYGSNTFEFRFPETLKKLSLTSLRLSLSSISMIGELKALEVLKFHRVRFEGNTWEIKEGEFKNLVFLELSYIDDLEWTSCDDEVDELGDLKTLVLDSISGFKKVPSRLETIPTLEMIDVSNCTRDVIKIVRDIEDKQLSLGNSSLKVIVGKTSRESAEGKEMKKKD